MLKLEQIKPYTLLLDWRSVRKTRVIKVAPWSGDSLPIIAADEEGVVHQIVLHRADEEFLQAMQEDAHMKSDPVAVLGCLLGGAVGDALGAPVEFLDWKSIQKKFGPRGIINFEPAYHQIGAITDDTQMMLFTAEGLLRAYVRANSYGLCHPPGVIHHSLLRWLLTQGVRANTHNAVGTDGWLFTEKRLWSQRAPGNTCINALNKSPHFGAQAENSSKGCGGVMRVAPCAFFSNSFQYAAESSQTTHGHPTGYLAAGLFADILSRIWQTKMPLVDAVKESLENHGNRDGMQETHRILDKVLDFVRTGILPTPEGIKALGGGWVAEEALAIGLWCALMAENFEDGVIRAVNHSGDSDSTGLIAGHFLGLIHGVHSIPTRWLENLELRDIIEQISNDISYVQFAYCDDDDAIGTPENKEISERYPGW